MVKKQSPQTPIGGTSHTLMADIDRSKTKFSSLGKSMTVASGLHELIELARSGDQTAIQFLFSLAGRMTSCVNELARDPKLRGKVRPVVEEMLAVPALISPQRKIGIHSRHAYDAFEIGKNLPRILRGQWDMGNEGTRTMVAILVAMAENRSSGKALPKYERTPLQLVCADLPSTRLSDEKKRAVACRKWRDAYVEFVGILGKTTLDKPVKLDELPGFSSFAARKANPMTGVKEQVLRFIREHLYI